MYWRSLKTGDTYTASGTMFVTNSNPNLINYGYTNVSDLSSTIENKQLRNFIRGGVHDGDDEFLREIQRGLRVVHGEGGAEHAVEGFLVHDFTGGWTRDIGGGEVVVQLFEGNGDGFRLLFAGEQADDGQQDHNNSFHNKGFN